MEQDTREFRAEARFQRVSPQKARLVLDLIKGRRVEEALNTLAFTKKGVAPLIEKILRSALQNANYLSGEQGLDVSIAEHADDEKTGSEKGPEAKSTGARAGRSPVKKAVAKKPAAKKARATAKA
jgi:ribosomal protein L22